MNTNVTNEKKLTHDGKSYEEMSLDERAKLFRSDEDLFRRMKEQHEERPWVGKSFGQLTANEKHRLANDRPHLYAEQKRAFDAAKEKE